MADKLVAEAIAREEAMERVVKASQRRDLAEDDHKKTRHKINLKLGEQINAAFKVGLTAKQMSREIGISVPRVYQLRNLYRAHRDAEFNSA